MEWNTPSDATIGLVGQLIFFGCILLATWSVSRRTEYSLFGLLSGKDPMHKIRFNGFEGALILLALIGGASLIFYSFDYEAHREAADQIFGPKR